MMFFVVPKMNMATAALRLRLQNLNFESESPILSVFFKFEIKNLINQLIGLKLIVVVFEILRQISPDSNSMT